MFIAHVTLPVRNARESAAFYQEVFGWPQIERPSAPSTPAGTWLKIGIHQQLHVTERDDFEPPPLEDEFGRHFAIAVNESQFDAVIAALRQHAVAIILPKRDAGYSRLFLRDRDGYVVEVMVSEMTPPSIPGAPG